MKADEFLRRAANIMEERGRQYDQPQGERSMGRAVEAFRAITGHTLTEAEGWLFMQVLKDVRQWQRATYHPDSAEDCIAYAALKAEALSREEAQSEIAAVAEEMAQIIEGSLVESEAEESGEEGGEAGVGEGGGVAEPLYFRCPRCNAHLDYNLEGMYVHLCDHVDWSYKTGMDPKQGWQP